MTIYDLKPRFQRLLRPLCQLLVNRGITANQVTVTAAVLSLAAAVLVVTFADSRKVLLVVPFVLFIRMALNAIDGMMAREHGQKSVLGGYLNELGDIFSDTVLYGALALTPFFSLSLTLVLVLLAIWIEFAGVLGVVAGCGRDYSGPFGKSDRAFFFGLCSLLIAYDWLKPQLVFGLTIMAIALSLMTIRNRVVVGARGVEE